MQENVDEIYVSVFCVRVKWLLEGKRPFSPFPLQTTMEICSEYFGQHEDGDIYEYFREHYAHFFPDLRERTGFVRQAANLWFIKAMIQQRLTWVSGQAWDFVCLSTCNSVGYFFTLMIWSLPKSCTLGI